MRTPFFVRKPVTHHPARGMSRWKTCPRSCPNLERKNHTHLETTREQMKDLMPEPRGGLGGVQTRAARAPRQRTRTGYSFRGCGTRRRYARLGQSSPLQEHPARIHGPLV